MGHAIHGRLLQPWGTNAAAQHHHTTSGQPAFQLALFLENLKGYFTVQLNAKGKSQAQTN